LKRIIQDLGLNFLGKYFWGFRKIWESKENTERTIIKKDVNEGKNLTVFWVSDFR